MIKYCFNFFMFSFLLAQMACQDGSATDQSQLFCFVEPPPKPVLIKHDTDISINGRLVSIQYPNVKDSGIVLCLPGWNFKNTDVCNNSSFCNEAKKNGFILVFPDMGKSIYASKLYPETRKDWASYPQLKFITDTLIPILQTKFSLLKPGQNNFIYGISTGARGVAMVALHTDTLFNAGAALSGDYEPTRMLKDNLMNGYYGPFSKFKDRWEDDDPYFQASKIKIPFYLAAGGNDQVVPSEQTKIFYDQLQKVNKNLVNQLHIADTAGHNYGFWGSETMSVLNFFKKTAK